MTYEAAIRALKKHLERVVTEIVLLPMDNAVQPVKTGCYLLNADGGVRNGEAAVGWVLSDPEDHVVATHSQKIERDMIQGAMTQGAEYMALVGALDFAHANGIDEIRVYLDNQLFVDQINGLAAVKHSTLKSLHGRVVDSLNTFSDQRVYWIP